MEERSIDNINMSNRRMEQEILPSIKNIIDDIIDTIEKNVPREKNNEEEKNNNNDESITVIKVKAKSNTISSSISTKTNRGRPLSRSNSRNKGGKSNISSPSRSPSPTKKEMMAEARLRAKQHTQNRKYEERWAKHYAENDKEVVKMKQRLEEIENEKMSPETPTKIKIL